MVLQDLKELRDLEHSDLSKAIQYITNQTLTKTFSEDNSINIKHHTGVFFKHITYSSLRKQ